MPQFTPGEGRVAIATFPVKPAGLSCEAELFLGPDEVTKVATSDRIGFTSTGAEQSVNLPITMPTTGAYHVYIDIYAGGIFLAAYQAIEDVVIAPAIPEIIIDLPDIAILGVEGIPFVSVEIETTQNWEAFGKCLQESYGPDWIINGVGLAMCMKVKGEATGLALKECGYEHPEYLSSVGALNWHLFPHQSAFSYCSYALAPFTGPAATLAEPIVMSQMRGVTLTCIFKVSYPESPWVTYTFFAYLWYEPQFAAPMPSPAFKREYHPYPPAGAETEVPIKTLFGEGYYYEGIYDGRFQFQHFYDGLDGTPFANFRIKNLARITGEGTV
ncbi:hypothetical protein ES703_53996 [subsurface metagenome]